MSRTPAFAGYVIIDLRSQAAVSIDGVVVYETRQHARQIAQDTDALNYRVRRASVKLFES